MQTPSHARSQPSAKRVTVIVDRAGGSTAVMAAEQEDVWLVESPENKSSAEMYWAASDPFPGSLTTFRPQGSAPDECAAGVLETIEDHHGAFANDAPYQELQVIGCGVTEALIGSLAAVGFVVIKAGAKHVLAAREA